MFARESEMAGVAARWMKARGLTVRSEFVLPWGICDLVGVRFNHKNVTHRLKLKQTRPVSSITRAALLLQIPDLETGKSITLDKLVQQWSPCIPEEVIKSEMLRLINGHFVVPSSRGKFQRVNGWMPLQNKLVAVELKLSRIDEVMNQALNNLGFAQQSYVALPSDVARRVKSNRLRWSRFFDAGIGLLSVGLNRCQTLIPAQENDEWTEDAIRFYCVEKFWRTHLKGN